MSYSNIIKLHNLRAQKTVVGRGSAGRRPGAGFPLKDEEGTHSPGESGIAGHHQTIAWNADPQDLLRMARAEAETILLEASSKAEEVRLQAYDEGYHKGQTDGLDEARATASEHTHRIAELAETVATDMTRILNNSEEGIVSLALAVAEKIVLKSLEEDRALVVAMVKWALEQVDLVDVLRIRINPEDYEILRAYWENGQIVSGGGKFDLTPDPRVQIGGCIIDTNKSVVDAQIGTKLAEIEQAFRSQMDASAR